MADGRIANTIANDLGRRDGGRGQRRVTEASKERDNRFTGAIHKITVEVK